MGDTHDPTLTRREAVALLAAAPALTLATNALAGCSALTSSPATRTRATDVPFNAAVLYYSYDDPYIASVRDALSADLASAAITYHEYDAGNDQSTQDAQVDQALLDGASVLVVNIVTSGNAEIADTICRKASAVDVPVVFFNRPVEGVGDEGAILGYYDTVAFVGTDPAEAGHLQGQMIGSYLAEHYDECDLNGDGTLSYVLFKGQASNPESVYRTIYSVEDANAVLEEAGRPDLAYFDPNSVDRFHLDLTGSWSMSSAQDYMENDLDHYTEEDGSMVEVVIANSDTMAEGAIRALQAHGYNTGEAGSTTIPVFGVDATEAGRELIAQGAMTGTVAQDSAGMAECVCAMVANARGGRDLLVGLDDYARDTENHLERKVYIPYSIYEPEG